MFVIEKVLANRENKTEFARKCENFFLYSMGTTFLKLTTRSREIIHPIIIIPYEVRKLIQFQRRKIIF